MTNLTPEEKNRLNSIFGEQAFSGSFTIENGDLDKIFDRPKMLQIMGESGELQNAVDRLNRYGTTNPVAIAHRILSDCYLEQNLEPMNAIQDAIAYLEEALTK